MSSVIAAFRDAATRDPDAPVLIDALSGAAISRSETLTRAACWAGAVVDGYPPGAIVPLLAGRTADTLAMIVACMTAGRPFAVLNPRLRPMQLAEVLRQAGGAALCIDAMGAACLYRDRRQLGPLGNAAVLRIAPETWPERTVAQAAQVEGLVAQLDLLRVSAAGQVPATGSPELPSACLFTSGSTGTPKGVLISQADLFLRAEAEIKAFGLRPGDRILNLLPWSFDVGLNQLLTALIGGAVLVVQESWLPADIAAATQQHAIAGISAVPSIWRGFLSSGMALQAGQLRYATVSGGSLRPEEYDRLASAMPGVSLLKTYGQTETFRSTLATPEDVSRVPTTVGRPFAGARVYIVDPDLAQLPRGKAGEVLHAGLGTMLGYLGGGCAKKRIPNPFHGVDGDDAPYAVMTGDLGHLDADGCLHLHGRADDMVKVNGNRVYLQEITALAASLDEIGASHAFAVQEPGGDTAIELAVVLARGAEPKLDGSSLRARLAKILPSYMCPRRVTLVSEIPLTASGKPDGPALRRALDSHCPAEHTETFR